jgi:predicted RNA-binding Zn ribbon-like protein
VKGKQETVVPGQPRFDLSGGAVCLNFINTLDDRPTEAKETLNSFSDLVRFCEQSGILDPAQVEHYLGRNSVAPEQARAGLERAIELREALFAIFTAVVNRSEVSADALQTLNELSQEAGKRSILVERNRRFAWAFADRFSCDAVLWPIAQSAVDLLVLDRLLFVRTCSSKTCEWFFFDTSKNHRRRWCNMKVCGNQAKVARFYRRQKNA